MICNRDAAAFLCSVSGYSVCGVIVTITLKNSYKMGSIRIAAQMNNIAVFMVVFVKLVVASPP